MQVPPRDPVEGVLDKSIPGVVYAVADVDGLALIRAIALRVIDASAVHTPHAVDDAGNADAAEHVAVVAVVALGTVRVVILGDVWDLMIALAVVVTVQVRSPVLDGNRAGISMAVRSAIEGDTCVPRR